MSRLVFYLIGFSFIGFSPSNAQNIKIKVVDKDSSALPYAYVLVNNKPKNICDSLGIVLIPLSELSYNDTISVSYIGARSLEVVYDKLLVKKLEHTFCLVETGYLLNEVLVKYYNIERLYKKSIDRVPALNYNCFLDGRFDAKFSHSTYNISEISGSFVVENELYSKDFSYMKYGWFHHPFKFTLNNSLSENNSLKIQTYINRALNFINLGINISYLESYANVKPVYSYLGEKENQDVFRIVYPKTYTIGYSYQILLFINKQSKCIGRIDFSAMEIGENKNNVFDKYKISAVCEVFSHKKPKRPKVILPVNMEFDVSMKDGSQILISLTDMSIKL